MRLDSERRSDNVEDRRGFSVGRGAVGGGAVLVAVVAALLGAPPEMVRDILGRGTQTTSGPARPVDHSPATEAQVDFVKAVLGSTEDTWTAIFSQRQEQYERPKLVLFTEAVQSACGGASAAVGPFYCPGDRRVYLDLEFFAELDRRFGAPGDFARAYVVAHEIGHHVQNLLGTFARTERSRRTLAPAQANQISVRLELQADCYAGVWGHHANKTRHILEPGDTEEALQAATSIGDDTLQRKARGQVTPESFTHGSSAQRVHWFKTGMTTGSLDACDTFKQDL